MALLTAAVIALSMSTVAAPPASLHGGLSVRSGPLKTNVTPGPVPQSITITVNGADSTYGDIIFCGNPAQVVGAGTQVTLILKNSTPLVANFSNPHVLASDSLYGTSFVRSVP